MGITVKPVLETTCIKRSPALTLSQTENLDSSELKEFADDNLKCDENGRKFSKRLEKSYGKRRNCS